MRRSCHKLRFPTEGAAVRFGRGRSALGRKMRAYFCRGCKGFHLTKEARHDDND